MGKHKPQQSAHLFNHPFVCKICGKSGIGQETQTVCGKQPDGSDSPCRKQWEKTTRRLREATPAHRNAQRIKASQKNVANIAFLFVRAIDTQDPAAASLWTHLRIAVYAYKQLMAV